ncbi:hypothetical protein MFLAVUS_000360 [Mucor flavus]|uniref:Uncharacterized protein n=1 Tax=Mucor flavus TaxID=439312 RepID=A0ABP9YJI0_9FUNG
MTPERQKRIKRKLPTRKIVDAEFVSSSASARIMDDILLPSHHDRAILSSLWDNQETTRSELPHVVIASTHRRLVQSSTNALEKTYLQRLRGQTKDSTDLSAQSIIPIALVNNMNAKATSTAYNATDSDSETETYTTLSPINQQVGTGTEQTFCYGPSHDPSTPDNNTGLCPDKTNQFQLSLNVLQVTGIDCLHTQGSLYNENDNENILFTHITQSIELEPDHSNVPMVAADESIVNDRAPVSIGQAVMMECEDSMEGETVNENEMMEEVETVNDDGEAETVNETDMMNDEAETVNETDMMDEAEDVNEKEAEVVNEKSMIETEIVSEKDHAVGNVNEKDDGMDIVVKREYEEESVEANAESAREDSEESSSVYNVVKRKYEGESVEADEAFVEAYEANTEKVVEGRAVENEEEEAVEEEADKEITLCMRSVEPTPCLFVTTARKDDLVPIKYEPLDECEYASSPEDPKYNASSCSSEEFMNNFLPVYSQKFIKTTVPDYPYQTASNATSDEVTHDVVSDCCYATASNAMSDPFNEGLNNDLPCTSDEFMNTITSSHSDVCNSEEEALYSQVLFEEPSSCLYRMPASVKREDSLVPIKQEPVNEADLDMATLTSPINQQRYDMVDAEVMVKQEPLEECCGPMEIERQDIPGISVGSPSGTGGDDDDWMAVEDLAGDEQDVVYDKIFDLMARPNESKPIRSKPGQKERKRLRPDAWIEDNKSPIVLTKEEEEWVCKRGKIMKAKLHKPFIIKKKMKCVWLVEADTA